MKKSDSKTIKNKACNYNYLSLVIFKTFYKIKKTEKNSKNSKEENIILKGS